MIFLFSEQHNYTSYNFKSQEKKEKKREKNDKYDKYGNIGVKMGKKCHKKWWGKEEN